MVNLQYGTYYSAHPGKAAPPFNKIIIFGLVAAIVIGGALLAITLVNGNSKQDVTLLGVRENSLLNLMAKSQKSIRDPNLNTVNSNSAILLAGDVTALLADAKLKAFPGDLVKKEADTNTSKLAQAALLNTFDTTYQGVILSKVSPLITQAKALRSSVGTTKTGSDIDHAIANLESINTQFTNLQLR